MSNISLDLIRLGGVSEVAQELGLSRQRVFQLRESPRFPSPLGEISAGPIWDLDEVARWSNSGVRRSLGRPSHLDEQRVLGDTYLLDNEPIGSGGFADVYRAVDTRRKQNHRYSVVAIKVLRRVDDFEKVRHRFDREIRLVADCDHPGVVRILDLGEDQDSRLWYAMPLAKGNLADAIDGFIGDRDAILRLMEQICIALAYVHQRGIFHRDIKPANILRVSKSRWAISDFGLARETESDTALTSTHRGLGTFVYAAPETLVDARTAELPADIFSLGKVLQHLVTGELPVEGNWNLGRFRTVIAKATRPDPTMRYESAEQMFATLEATVNSPEGWRSEEEVFDEFADRLRLESPDDSSIAELISRFDATTPTEFMETLDRAIPWMSAGSIHIAWRSHRESFFRLLEEYSTTVERSGYPFEFCDTIAGFWDRVLRITDDEQILYFATKALLRLGSRHNRWHVRSVLIEILQRVRDPHYALAAAEALKEASPQDVVWTLESFVIRSLHPTIRDEAEKTLPGAT